MQAFHTRSTVKAGHRLEIADVPFAEGEEVDILVMPRPEPAGGGAHPLRDTAVRYESPTAPVAEDDWEALR